MGMELRDDDVQFAVHSMWTVWGVRDGGEDPGVGHTLWVLAQADVTYDGVRECGDDAWEGDPVERVFTGRHEDLGPEEMVGQETYESLTREAMSMLRTKMLDLGFDESNIDAATVADSRRI